MDNVVYVINDLSDYFRVDYKGRKYTFNGNVPVKVDYTDDPRLVSYLLQFVQLRIAEAKEVTPEPKKEVKVPVKEEPKKVEKKEEPKDEKRIGRYIPRPKSV